MRVILIDDHEIFAKSLEFTFKHQKNNDINFTAFVETGIDQIKIIIEQNQPEIILLDIHLGETNGLLVATQLLAWKKNLKIIFLTGYDLVEYHNQAIKLGAKGFLNKNISIEELIDQIQYVHKGNLIFPELHKEYTELSEREIEVLQLLADGKTRGEIAEKLDVSNRTINSHLYQINLKLQVNSTVNAVVRATQLGIIRISHT